MAWVSVAESISEEPVWTLYSWCGSGYVEQVFTEYGVLRFMKNRYN